MIENNIQRALQDLVAIERDRRLGYPVSDLHKSPVDAIIDGATALHELGIDPDEVILPEDQEKLEIKEEIRNSIAGSPDNPTGEPENETEVGDQVVIRTDDGIIRANVIGIESDHGRPEDGTRMSGTIKVDEPKVHYMDYNRNAVDPE